jgi:lipoprotein-anchoring transpeptidase ErfK/SrfK
MRRATVVAAAALACAAVTTPAQARSSVTGPGTWWVSPTHRVALRQASSEHARATGRVHLLTEDGFPEVDLVVRQVLAAGGRRWLRVDQPAKPHAVAGWVPAADFTAPTRVLDRFVVDRARRRATLYRGHRVLWRAPVGVGKPSTPTPPGHYWVREKFPVSADGLYGPRAFGTSDYSPYETDWPEGGIVGIHGTDEPGLIPGDPSHGCVRVRNRDIMRLYRLMPIGTPVVIR